MATNSRLEVWYSDKLKLSAASGYNRNRLQQKRFFRPSVWRLYTLAQSFDSTLAMHNKSALRGYTNPARFQASTGLAAFLT
ncbi:hypothetical protein EYC80_009192 [Monilinia laxa]|uniref:Uncharacterized protein n=1 Tax=Monilinia laxa TaxID=61186 RepID=A0A5N6JX35_MONLA|nr:hypothetical protein EYC80_009192 [Monilinia laxa]